LPSETNILSEKIDKQFLITISGAHCERIFASLTRQKAAELPSLDVGELFGENVLLFYEFIPIYFFDQSHLRINQILILL